MKFTTEKTTVELYKIRGGNGSYADITIDAKDNTGRISISSDFGTWSYFWGACGEEFKPFLTGLDIDYAAGKFGENKWFDYEATMSGLKRRIGDYGKTDLCDGLFSELNFLKGREEVGDFMATIRQCREIMELEDNMPDMVLTISPGFRKFWETLWKHFTFELRKELLKDQ